MSVLEEIDVKNIVHIPVPDKGSGAGIVRTDFNPSNDNDVALAKTKLEEASMFAVKSITADQLVLKVVCA